MKKTLALWASLVVLTSALPAQITVAHTAPADHTTIGAAISASTPGETIQIIEAGTYPETISMPNGDLTIEATVAGVIVGTGVSGGITFNPTADTTSTIRNITYDRTAGSGAVIDIDQPTTPGMTLTVVLEDVVAQSSNTAREALKFDDGAGVAGGSVVFTATGCTFDGSAADPGDRAAVRVQADNADFDNLTVTMTTCIIMGQATSGSGAAFRLDDDTGSSVFENHVWLLDDCTITAPLDRGFEIDDPFNNCSFTIQNSSISSEEEAIIISETGATASSFTIKRSTVDSAFGAGVVEDRLTDIRMGTGCTANYFNNILIVNEDLDADENERGIYVEGSHDFNAFHNTIVGVGVLGSGNALNVSSGYTGTGLFSNNIVDNFIDPIGGSTGAVTRTGNLYSIEDTSGGSDRIIADPNLDGNYIAQDPSDVFGAGDPSASIATAVEDVDFTGGTRPLPAATNPDIGAHETVSVPVEISSFMME